jgi:putative flavoprotein involved in K+ transport
MKLLRRHSGYYVNVGASELIIEGKIKLRSGVGLAYLDGSDAVFTDGSRLAIDVLVLATGYKPQQEGVRKIFGDDIADRVGPVWGLRDDGELRNMFGPTRQPGFHIVGGPMLLTRSYSRYTAVLIKAEIEGLPPERERIAADVRASRMQRNAQSA